MHRTISIGGRYAKAGAMSIAVMAKMEKSANYDHGSPIGSQISQKIVSSQKCRPLPFCLRAASTVACDGPSGPISKDVSGFEFEGKPVEGTFSPIFRKNPAWRTAAVNVGDVGLELGRGPFNKGFYKVFKDTECLPDVDIMSPHGPCKKYGELHRMLLEASLQNGGGIVCFSNSSNGNPEVAALLRDLNLSCAYGCAGKKLKGDMPGFEGACGAVFLDVFVDEKRPYHHHNLAMLYVNGPKGKQDYTDVRSRNDGDKFKRPPRGHLIESRNEFVQILKGLGCRAMQVVAHHNGICRNSGAHDQIIEDVRWPLVSGSNVRLPNVSMLEVAISLQVGIQSAKVSEFDAITATFLFDKDENNEIGLDHGIFQEAWHVLQRVPMLPDQVTF